MIGTLNTGWMPNSRVLLCAWHLLAALLFSTVLPQTCHGTDQSSGPNLEEYLKQMGYEAVEFEKNDHIQPFVWGTLSNGHKHKLLVDTGWGISTLSESTAQGLKRIGELNTVFEDTVLGTITNQNLAVMDKLTIGQAQFVNQPVRVEPLRVDYIVVPFDGVLGYDFLLRNFCLIDCWKRRLYFREQKLSDEQSRALEESLRLSGFTEIAMKSKHWLNVEAQVNGESVTLLLDTGAPFEELDDSELKRLGLSVLRYDRAATGSYIRQDVTGNVLGIGDIGAHKVHATKVDTFRLGLSQWKGIYFGVTDLKPWGLAKPGTRGEGIKGFLSMVFLGRHGALIDLSANKLWLRPEEPAHRKP